MIEKIRTYFRENGIIDNEYRINVDFLGEEPQQFALEVIPTNPIVTTYINGDSVRQFQFQFLSCSDYGADVMQNISNSKFYENLYRLIEYNNEQKILPNIDGIMSIECLNNGAILNAGTNTAKYSIQMKITYYEVFNQSKEEEI